jgi:hypothetical protein
LKKTLTLTSKNIHFQTAIISLLINSLTNNSLFYAPILILFFFSLSSFTDKTSD